MAIHHKHIVTHAVVEGDFGDDIHTGIAELERDHGNVGLALPKELTTTSSALHYEKMEVDTSLANNKTSRGENFTNKVQCACVILRGE